MKNNKGFTLVELLAVIVILAILVTIAVPSTIGISNKLKENMFCKKIDSIEVAAKLYGEDRKSSFDQKKNFTFKNPLYDSKTNPSVSKEITENLSYKNITVKTLIESGDLKKDNNVCGVYIDEKYVPCIVDPRDNSELDDMSFDVYEKHNRIYVAFDESIKKTCDK